MTVYEQYVALSSGVGKTHLAAAIGHGLTTQSVRVRHFATTSLVQQLQLARTQLRLEDALQKLDKYAALILDDFGYVKKSEQETQVLFELNGVRLAKLGWPQTAAA
jgi:DNA replication protein DnaC